MSQKSRKATFNGWIVPYYYRCPAAYKYRVIDKIYPPKPEEGEVPEDDKRARGIRLHEEIHEYLKDGVPPSDFTPTETMVEAREAYVQGHGHSEHELVTDLYYDPTVDPLPGQVLLAGRPDFYYHEHEGKIRLLDWKSGNFNYGAPVYYDEIKWFACLIAAHNLDVSEIEIVVHFPLDDYTLPTKVLGPRELAGLQFSNTRRVQQILNDHDHYPIPSSGRCRYCDYKSERAGGLDTCPVAVE